MSERTAEQWKAELLAGLSVAVVSTVLTVAVAHATGVAYTWVVTGFALAVISLLHLAPPR
jgi:hypothetical protein